MNELASNVRRSQIFAGEVGGRRRVQTWWRADLGEKPATVAMMAGVARDRAPTAQGVRPVYADIEIAESGPA